MLKMYFDKVFLSDKFVKYEVKIDYDYKVIVEISEVFVLEERIKGFCYGFYVIFILSDEMEIFKFKIEKGMKFFGFIDVLNIFW